VTSAAFVQGRVNRMLRHRYTWLRRADDPTGGGVDDWGNPLQTIQTPPAPVPTTDKICLYRDTSKFAVGDSGPVQVEINELTVAWDDPIQVGDYVASVTDPETGRTLIVDPTRVESIAEIGPHGAVVYRVLTLHGAEVV